MGTNIMIECSVLLSDEELIAVNINAPRLPLHLNEQQYGALLGMIYGNFAELPVIVPPLLPEKCSICGGHHFDNLQCYSPWLTLTLSIDEAPVTVMDMVPDMVTRYGNHYGNQNCKQIVIKVGALKVLGPPRTVSRYGTSGGPAISCRP